MQRSHFYVYPRLLTSYFPLLEYIFLSNSLINKCLSASTWLVGLGCVSLQIQVNCAQVAAKASDCWSRKKQKRTKGKRTKKPQNPTPKRVTLPSRMGPRLFFFCFFLAAKGVICLILPNGTGAFWNWNCSPRLLDKWLCVFLEGS